MEQNAQSRGNRMMTCMQKPSFLLALGLINFVLLLATRCSMHKMHAMARGFGGDMRHGMMQGQMMQGGRGGQYRSHQGRSRGTQGGMMQGKRMMQGQPAAVSDDAQGAEGQGVGPDAAIQAPAAQPTTPTTSGTAQ